MAEEGRLSTGWIALGALLVAAATLWPFTQALYLPLTDLPNHIARHTIMAADDASPLLDYWSADFVIVPNTAVDLLWQLFGAGGDAIVFSHRIMAIAALNLFAAAMVLARVIHGHWTWWSLAAGLVVFNATFLFGFQNYVFSVPFGIYAFALYLWLEPRPAWQRALVFLAITPVLFLMHFFAFAVLGALVFGRELQKLFEAGPHWRRALGASALIAIPFLLPVIWLLLSLALGPENPAGSRTELPTLHAIIRRFLTPISTSPTDLTGAMNGFGRLAILALYVAFFTAFFRTRWGLHIAPVMRGPLVVLFLAVLAAPDWLSGVALIGIRFPFVFILVMIAATELRLPAQRQSVAILAVILAFIGVRSHQMAGWWGHHDSDMRDLSALMEETLEPGDRLIPVRAPGRFPDTRHWHVQAYAAVEQDAFFPTLFQGVHAVQLRAEWEDHATALMHANPACALFEKAEHETFIAPSICPDEPYTERWEQKFDKLLAMEALPDAVIAGEPVTLIATRGRYQMYRVDAPDAVEQTARAALPVATGKADGIAGR